MKNPIKVLAVLICIIWTVPLAVAQTIKVLDRGRVGNGIEDITYVDTGLLTGNLVWIDGVEIIAAPTTDKQSKNNAVLFRVTGLPFKTAPRGITYLSPEGKFALIDTGQSDRFFVVDKSGVLTDTRTIVYPEGSEGGALEGLAYIPADAPIYPDHLLIMNNTSSSARIEVVQRSGQVDAEIIFAEPFASMYLAGLAFLAPNQLLVTASGTPDICVFDMNAQLLKTVGIDGAAGIEGIVQLPNGQVMAADFGSGLFFALDSALNRLPADDRDYHVGFGMTYTKGLAWDSKAGQFLVLNSGSATAEQGIYGIPLTFGKAIVRVSDPNFPAVENNGISYVSGEDLIAAGHNKWPWLSSPPAILLYGQGGAMVQTIDLTGIMSQVSGVEYVPTRQQFVVRGRIIIPNTNTTFQGFQFINRNGTPGSCLNFGTLGIGKGGPTAYFDPKDPSGGKLLFIGAINGVSGAIVIDLNGSIVSTCDATSLGLLELADLTAITTGKYAGAFAAIDMTTTEIVIFKFK